MEAINRNREYLPLGSDRFRASVFHADAVERRLCCNEQRFIVVSAEGDVGGAFGDGDAFQQFAVGVENIDSAMRCVEIALRIDRHSVAAFVDRE